MPLMFGHQDSFQSNWGFIAGLVTAIIIMLVIGFFVVKKSEYFSKKIIRENGDEEESVLLSRVDILTISVIILSLYFLITGFPSFISSVFSLVTSFIDDFKLFKETLSGNTWRILQYILTLIIFLYAKAIAVWIERKIMK